MAGRGPGKAYRKGLTLTQLIELFPDNRAAEEWFEAKRWPDGRFCPDCGSTDTVEASNRSPMPCRCRSCKKYFSVRKGTVLQSEKVGLQKWVIAIYQMSTGLTGTSSMKLHRDLGVRQATAWFMMHRIREGYDRGDKMVFPGPLEADETYVGGKRKNMHKSKRAQLSGRGAAGKVAVAGVKDRGTRNIVAQPVPATDSATLQGFVVGHALPGATVYTDDAKAYKGLPRRHCTVNHSAGEYVCGDVHTNGMESFWSVFKRGYHGTFHHVSPKHLSRYVAEFCGRHNARELDTIDQMSRLLLGMVGRRLSYSALVGAASPSAQCGVAVA